MRQNLNVPFALVKPYVQGKVYEYFSQHGDEKVDVQLVNQYISDTMFITLDYLAGKEVLDARASDTQCAIAQSAYFEFKQFKEQI